MPIFKCRVLQDVQEIFANVVVEAADAAEASVLAEAAVCEGGQDACIEGGLEYGDVVRSCECVVEVTDPVELTKCNEFLKGWA